MSTLPTNSVYWSAVNQFYGSIADVILLTGLVLCISY